MEMKNVNTMFHKPSFALDDFWNMLQQQVEECFLLCMKHPCQQILLLLSSTPMHPPTPAVHNFSTQCLCHCANKIALT